MGVQVQKLWERDSEITGDPKGPLRGPTFWSAPTLKNLPEVPVGNCKMKKPKRATFFEFKMFHNESQSASYMI